LPSFFAQISPPISKPQFINLKPLVEKKKAGRGSENMFVFQYQPLKTALTKTEEEALRSLQRSIDEIKNTISGKSSPSNGSLKIPLGGKNFNSEVDLKLGQLKKWLEKQNWEVNTTSNYRNGVETERIFVFYNQWLEAKTEEPQKNKIAKPTQEKSQKPKEEKTKSESEYSKPQREQGGQTYKNYQTKSNYTNAAWAIPALDFAKKYLFAEGQNMGKLIEQNIVPILNSTQGWSDSQKEQFLNYFVAIAAFMPEQKLKAFCSLHGEAGQEIHPLASTLSTWNAQNANQTMFNLYRAASGEEMIQDDLQASGSLLDFARLKSMRQKFADISIKDDATGEVSKFHANTINPYAIYEFSMFSAGIRLIA
jgi:hypothetical protein